MPAWRELRPSGRPPLRGGGGGSVGGEGVWVAAVAPALAAEADAPGDGSPALAAEADAPEIILPFSSQAPAAKACFQEQCPYHPAFFFLLHETVLQRLLSFEEPGTSPASLQAPASKACVKGTVSVPPSGLLVTASF